MKKTFFEKVREDGVQTDNPDERRKAACELCPRPLVHEGQAGGRCIGRGRVRGGGGWLSPKAAARWLEEENQVEHQRETGPEKHLDRPLPARQAQEGLRSTGATRTQNVGRGNAAAGVQGLGAHMFGAATHTCHVIQFPLLSICPKHRKKRTCKGLHPLQPLAKPWKRPNAITARTAHVKLSRL